MVLRVNTDSLHYFKYRKYHTKSIRYITNVYQLLMLIENLWCTDDWIEDKVLKKHVQNNNTKCQKQYFTPGTLENKIPNLKRYVHSNIHCSIFTVAKICKKSKYPLIHEWIKKIQWNISHKEEIATCDNTGRSRGLYTKWSKSKRNTNTI